MLCNEESLIVCDQESRHKFELEDTFGEFSLKTVIIGASVI